MTTINGRLGLTGTVTIESTYLRWDITAPTPANFTYGSSSMIPLVGDWNEDGIEGIGAYEPNTGTFFLKQTATGGNADIAVQFGSFNLTPISWYYTAKGDRIGVIQESTVYLDTDFLPGAAEIPTTIDSILCYTPIIKQCIYTPITHLPYSKSIYETHPYYYNGTFKSLTDKISDIADLGIDAIYLMPIWKHRDINFLWDVYGIKDYYDIGPEYGTPQELKELVNTVHSYGMEIIFDLVTPHATANGIVYNNNWTLNISLANLQSIATTNGWTLNYGTVDGTNIVYEGKQLQPDGNYIYNFYGTIIDNNVIAYTVPYIWGPAVDRSNPQVIEYFTNVAKYYVQEYDIDGWRIDVPGNVYNPIVFPGDHSSVNLLTSIINTVKNIKPDAIFIAEPGVPFGVSVNMEYVNIPFTGIMQGVIGNTITTPQLIDYIINIVSNTPLLVIESHDIPRLNINYPIHNKNFMVLISTLYGSPFIQAGQEIGATNNWINAEVDWINGDYLLRDFYKKVLSIRNSDNTIKYGFIESIWKSGDNIYAYSKTYENKIAVLLNFSNVQTISTLNIPFKNDDIIIDQLSGEIFNVIDPTNFIINVPAYSSRILTLPYPSQTTYTPPPSDNALLYAGIAAGLAIIYLSTRKK